MLSRKCLQKEIGRLGFISTLTGNVRSSLENAAARNLMARKPVAVLARGEIPPSEEKRKERRPEMRALEGTGRPAVAPGAGSQMGLMTTIPRGIVLNPFARLAVGCLESAFAITPGAIRAVENESQLFSCNHALPGQRSTTFCPGYSVALRNPSRRPGILLARSIRLRQCAVGDNFWL